ncbi:MAG: hypothetical protein FWH38_04675 [Treponema sp.]|nr:hypothetical protein [Treponema sp.]
MTRRSHASLLLIVLLAACAGQRNAVIFIPDKSLDDAFERGDSAESWQIVESQNGPGEYGIPEWVRRYFDRDIRGMESLSQFREKYLFVSENRGENFPALMQWANNFSPAHDLPGLVAQRMERKLVASAALYPDDEYGEYFAGVIKKLSDGEYPGAAVEQSFWLKRNLISNAETPAEATQEDPDTASTRYEFLVLISIDKDALQEMIREIMSGVRAKVSPTRDQIAAINRVQNGLFEGF